MQTDALFLAIFAFFGQQCPRRKWTRFKLCQKAKWLQEGAYFPSLPSLTITRDTRLSTDKQLGDSPASHSVSLIKSTSPEKTAPHLAIISLHCFLLIQDFVGVRATGER